jgi:hypothetical protein
MLTNDKITEIFCMTDEFCRKFNEEVKNSINYRNTAYATVIAPARCARVKS